MDYKQWHQICFLPTAACLKAKFVAEAAFSWVLFKNPVGFVCLVFGAGVGTQGLTHASFSALPAP